MRIALPVLVIVAAATIVLFLEHGSAAEERRDLPWGNWIALCRSKAGSASCDYDDTKIIGRTIQPDESDVWLYVGELTNGHGAGFNCYNSRTPMCLDEGPDTGAVLPGIFRYEGDLLIRCYSEKHAPIDARGQCEDRPTEFVSTDNNGFHIEILRRGEMQEQLGGTPTSRQHPDSEKPPYPAIPNEWRVITHCENGETTVPSGKAAWLIRKPWVREGDYHPSELNGLCYGPMIFSMNPSWLDEVRLVEGTSGSKCEIRPGLCRRAGDCLLWIVAPEWEPNCPTRIPERQTRPVSFRATKQNKYVLRVLYPADQMK